MTDLTVTLSDSQIRMLLEALDAWEGHPSLSNLLASMMGTLAVLPSLRNDPEAAEKIEQQKEADNKKAANEVNMRKMRALPLKARLAEALLQIDPEAT